MNTDFLLDFVVDNYIWFIIGGVIIFFAIIGFIVDKKKILPTSSNNTEGNLKNEIDTKEIKQSDKMTTEITEKTEDLKDRNSNFETTISNNESNLGNDDSINYLNLDDEEIKLTESEDSNDAFEILDENDDVVEVSESETSSSNVNLNDDDIKQSSSSTSSDIAFANFDEEINHINELNFSDNNAKDGEQKSEEENQQNEKLEDTMQISYSQLKEIVQDIIAENELEENSNKEIVEPKKNIETSNNVEISNQNNTVQDDEDDVWKF